MSGNFFLDTNLLVYAMDPSDSDKQAVALKWLATAHETGNGIVSYQVVQEWFNVVLRKAANPLSLEVAAATYGKLIQPLWRIQSSRELLSTAIELHQHNHISWWDSLIVGAAIQADCTRIITEDLEDGSVIRNVKIQNPF